MNKEVFDPLLGKLRTADDVSVQGGGSLSSSTGTGTNAPLITEDEGTTLSSTTSSINFTGAGVTASASGNDVTVDIPGGSAGSGDVVGPSSATDNAIARYDGTTGKLIQDSGASIDDSGNITATNLSGTNTGDQDLSGYVPTTRTVNGHTLSANVTVTASDIGLGNVDNTSDATKNAAAVALTNKDLTSGTNTFPTFNQNTTGSAAKWTTARNLAGNSVDGSANVAFTNKFIVQGTSDSGLSAAQFLGSLSTGLVKNTTTTGVLSIATAGSDYTSPSSTETMTNKRLTPRVTSITSSATPTINTDDCDAVTITAQAAAITSMTTNLSGTPNNFDKLIIRIKDDGSARAITWGASFEAKGIALPTTTITGKVLTVGLIYDSVTSKWGCVAVAQEA